MIVFEESGDFKSMEKFLKAASSNNAMSEMRRLGQACVSALKASTPTRSGKTAGAWRYEVSTTGRGIEIEILNSNINKGVSVARLIHYGHGTGTGGYVPPTPFIDKAIDSVYKKQIDSVFKAILKG